MLTSVGVPVVSEAEPSLPDPARPILLCFSHLRWDFVFQRPQHLMSRFARTMTVVFWEEPIDIGPRETPYLKVRQAEDYPKVRVVTPHLPEGLDGAQRDELLSRLLDVHVSVLNGPLITWYYTPMMLPFSRHAFAKWSRSTDDGKQCTLLWRLFLAS